MLNEIIYLHSKMKSTEAVRIITLGQNYMVDKTDLLKKTETDMLRVCRADGHIFTINPNYIVGVCTLPRRSALS